jgi:hypothetical protein
VVARELAAGVQRAHVGFEQLLLAAVLLGKQLLDHCGIDVHQRRQRAQHHDVLEQLPLARILVGGVADRGHRHADRPVMSSRTRWRERLRAVVEEVAPGSTSADVLAPRLRVNRHHHVDGRRGRPSQPRSEDGRTSYQGRQTLDVCSGRCCAGDRHAHAQDRLREQLVRRRRARSR